MLQKYRKFIFLIVFALGLAAAWYLLPIDMWAQSFSKYADSMGIVGFAVFAVVYIVATVLLLPASALTIAAGVAYGFWGVPLVLLAATLGASMAFLLGRYAFRDRVKKYLSNKPKMKAARDSVDKDEWTIMSLLRLSQAVPFNLLNYLLGTTEVSFSKYAVTTFFGIIPGTTLYVYIGTLGASAGSASPFKLALLGVGLVATVIVYFVISRKVNATLNGRSRHASTYSFGFK